MRIAACSRFVPTRQHRVPRGMVSTVCFVRMALQVLVSRRLNLTASGPSVGGDILERWGGFRGLGLGQVDQQTSLHSDQIVAVQVVRDGI